MNPALNDSAESAGGQTLQHGGPKNTVSWGISVAFMAAICIPPLLLSITWSRATLEFENRRTEPWPEWTVGNFRDLAGKLERAFNDRFGGRDALVKLHNLFQAAVLKVSPSPRVVVGLDGWLFVRGDWYNSLLSNQILFPRATNLAIAQGIERRARAIQKLGITYRLLYTPEKHTVYPEHLDPRVRSAAARTRMDEVLQLLPPDVRSLVVDLREPLLTGKRTASVFYMTDSHWNAYGAWIGSSELAKSLGLSPESYPPPEALNRRRFVGDLARMIGADLYFSEVDFVPNFMSGAKQDECRQPRDTAPRESVYIFRCADAPLDSAVIYRDSFGIMLSSFVSKFAKTTTVVESAHVLDLAWLEQNRPKVLIDQIVERGLPRLALRESAFEPWSLADRPTSPGTFSCTITSITALPHTGHPTRVVQAMGRLLSVAWRTPPKSLQIILSRANEMYAAEADFRQPALSSFYGGIAAEPDAVLLTAAAGQLPDGTYQVGLAAEFETHVELCRTSAEVKIPSLSTSP